MSGDFTGRAVFVTGAAGFIGSHLCRRLVAVGARVHAFVRDPGSSARLDDLRTDLTEWHGDVRDYDALLRALREAQPAAVFHLAGNTAARRFYGNWGAVESSLAVNLGGTINVLRAALESGAPVRAFVRAGGLEEYGSAPTPYEESQREEPVSPYSASQVATTHYCRLLQRQTSTPIVTLRPALVYGPAQSTGFFIPSLISSCLRGADFEMTQGTQTRDLLYVDDVVDAFLLAASRPGLEGAIVNVASGVEHRIVDVAREVVRLTGSGGRLRIGARPDRPSDLQRLVARADLAERLLGWRPKVGLTEGLERTVAWYRERMEVAAA